MKTKDVFLVTKIVIIALAMQLLSACGGGGGGGGGPVPKSSGVTYSSISVLGSNVNDPVATDTGPEISANGLELYFQSNRAGGSGSFDIWVSKRSSKTASWGAATNLGDTVNSASDDRAPTISKDGLTLIFASDRAGGFGGMDLYMTTRATLTNAWSTPVNLGTVINTAANESGPEISADGLSLYLVSDAAGGFGFDDLYVTTRPTLGEPWGVIVNLGGVVNTDQYDLAPEIASDGLSLYFHSTRAGGPGAHNIWKSTRASVSDAWSAPVVLPAPVNTAVSELTPSLSDDWQTLYFASDTGGNRNIWQAVP